MSRPLRQIVVVERLVGLGATVKQEFDDHTWLLDPEGNDFCATDDAGGRSRR